MPHKFKRSQSDFRTNANVMPSRVTSNIQHKSNHADCYRAYFATPDCGVLVSFLLEEVHSCLREMALDEQNRRALSGHCDKLPDHLSALAGVPINRYTVKQRSLGLHVSLCDGDSQLI